MEFASPEDSQRAVRELSEAPLLGRPVFIREDRENESRFRATPVPGKIGMAMAGQGLNAQPPPRPPHHNYFGTQQNPGNQLYVGNLPYQAGWQDLKDLFRAAGNIIRADGRPKGSGTVVFETQTDTQQAITALCCLVLSVHSVNDVTGMYNSFDWYGRTLEDNFAVILNTSTHCTYVVVYVVASEVDGQWPARDFSSKDIYADYPGPDQSGGLRGLRVDSYTGGDSYIEPEPSQQIMVRNVSFPRGCAIARTSFIRTLTAWSTVNEDLVGLFETTGQVQGMRHYSVCSSFGARDHYANFC